MDTKSIVLCDKGVRNDLHTAVNVSIVGKQCNNILGYTHYLDGCQRVEQYLYSTTRIRHIKDVVHTLWCLHNCSLLRKYILFCGAKPQKHVLKKTQG